MKFPESVHAEGSDTPIDTATSSSSQPSAWMVKTPSRSLRHGPGAARVGGGAKISASTPYAAMSADGASTARPAAPIHQPSIQVPAQTPVQAPIRSEPRVASTLNSGGAGTATLTPPHRSATPWLVGAGVGLGVIALAVTMSLNLSNDRGAPALVVSQADTSAQDAALRSDPPAAGLVTPSPETQTTPEATTTPADPAAPAVTPPAAEPARAVAAAPVEPKPTPEPKVARAEPAPVTKTLAAEPRREAALVPLAPVTPVVPAEPATVTPAPVIAPMATASAPMIPPVAVVTPETAAPVTAPVNPPVVAQAEPQPLPPAVNPEDTGITVKVRQALAADTTLAAVPIAVSTDHGVVKLEGQAPDAQARERATVVAAATTGVKGVDNRLTVPPVAMLGPVTASGG